MNLHDIIEQIKTEPQWKEADRNAITIYKTDGLRIVLIALHKNAQLTTHEADGIISIQILEGQLHFMAKEKVIDMGVGELVALHEGIPHSMMAKEETVFLLTLTNSLLEK